MADPIELHAHHWTVIEHALEWWRRALADEAILRGVVRQETELPLSTTRGYLRTLAETQQIIGAVAAIAHGDSGDASGTDHPTPVTPLH